MNASLRWLSDLLGVELDAALTRDRLTMLGAGVEALEPLHGGLGDIVIGEVLEVRRHPNADRLTLCLVDAGGQAKRVVCGAANVAAGRRYPFAPVGARLPEGLMIERRTIRGEVSEGMLCSARELGLGDDQEGILELDTAAAPGTRLLDALPIADTRFVLEITPNRPDLLSHQGIARDLGAVLMRAVKLPVIPGAPAQRPPRAARARGARGDAGGVPIAVEDVSGCRRYTAAVLRGVGVGPSPAWLRNRLAAIGARSVNNVVDATNYILFEVGQPIHAFDLAKLRGPAIVVRRARAGEALTTLDGVRRRLDPSMTVIADAEVATGVAGVMGGAESEVSAATTDVLLECAYFDPRQNRATRRAMGMSTEASYRFERGIDHDATPEYLGRAIELLLAVAGGHVDGVPVDVYPDPIPPTTVFLRDRRIADILGVEIPRGETERVLTALGCVVAPKHERLAVQVPAARPDLTREIDLIEEVARIVGYDRFPDDMRPYRIGVVPDAPSERVAARLRRALTALGLHEAMTSPLGPRADPRSPEVLNPLSREEAFLRSELLPGLVRRVEHNWRLMQRDVRLFEIGTVFERREGELPAEEMRVAGVLTGARRPPHWSEPATPDLDLFDAVAGLEAAVAVALAGAVLEPGSVGLVVRDAGGRAVGRAAELAADRPAWAAPLVGFEVAVGTGGAPAPRVRPLPKSPAVERDIALVLPAGLRAADVETVLRSAAGPLLERLWPFDEYRGAPLPAGSRSVAWRLVFRAPERTLREVEVEAALQRALTEVEARYGVRRRAS
ncbi:MAG: phenylalanine--tRNA ligase subunit beta [Gemmatimonadetes bacterium]|nr:phenylalanine--tRNA ligase subunit beta [Gemmatimonadota bacterium]